MSDLVYQVRFRPGRYRATKNPVNELAWMIGRVDDGKVMGFAFSLNEAAHIVLALNLVDSYIAGGDATDQREILAALDKLRQS